jgi:hypothetical protein
VLGKEAKPKVAKQLPNRILDSFNKILNVLTNDLLKSFPLCKDVDHKIEVVFELTSLSKTPYN